MKKIIAMLAVLLLALTLSACGGTAAPTSQPTLEPPTTPAAPTPAPEMPTPTAVPTPSPTPTPKPPMTASSAGIEDGVLGEEYGKRGYQTASGTPTLSPPVEIQNAPDETVSFAIIMLDPDSVPLAGFSWVHWLAAGIGEPELSENVSIDMADTLVQGRNSFYANGYGGPTPPDKPHTYVFTVYALDFIPELANGFTQEELLSAMDGHILAEAEFTGTYSN